MRMYRYVSGLIILLVTMGTVHASITAPRIVKGVAGTDGKTSDDRVTCRMILLSGGNVECQLTLSPTIADPNWTLLRLKDGDETHLYASLLGIKNDAGSRTYTVTIARHMIRNSDIAISLPAGQGALSVELASITLTDDWTDSLNPKGWELQQVLGTYGRADIDSRTGNAPAADDAPYVLTWRYNNGKNLSVRIQNGIAIDAWRVAK